MISHFSKLIILFIFIFSSSANSSLSYRGDGLVYDDYLDITWLLDANYLAELPDTPSNGRLTWDQTIEIVDNLTLAGSSDWRLPRIGTGTAGDNITDSELGHMFYVNLGNIFGSSILNNVDFIDSDTSEVYSFENVQSYAYWFESEHTNSDYAWNFVTINGYQGVSTKNLFRNAWLVHDGDIANGNNISEVPIPPSALLFFTSLLGLMVGRREANS